MHLLLTKSTAKSTLNENEWAGNSTGNYPEIIKAMSRACQT